MEVGIYESFSPEKTQTIKELLAELGLSDKYLAVLVNGKKAEPDAIVSETDNIVILPHIAGGADVIESDERFLHENCKIACTCGDTLHFEEHDGLLIFFCDDCHRIKIFKQVFERYWNP